MITLSSTIKKKGFTYCLLKRGVNTMIYEQRDGQITVGYEVFKIIIDKPKDIMGKLIPAMERFPKNNDFGKTAWAITWLELALRKFNKLENSGN